MITIEDGKTLNLKFKFGGFKYSVSLKRKGDHLWLDYGFNKEMTEDFKKTFSGMTWHGYRDPPIKQWSIAYDEHNLFQIAHYAGLKPYDHYDSVIKEIESKSYNLSLSKEWPLREHQKDIVHHIIKGKRVIEAAEMGLGKSLSVIAAFETVKPNKVFWVSINSALLSVRLEYKKWDATVPTRFMTYDELKKVLKEVVDDSNWVPPQFIIFDESQKIKTTTTQRTQAAIYLVQRATEYWGDDLFVVLLTGTPAPKSPLDWYSQCEIARPGFLKEGSIYSFKDRLAIIEKKENAVTGGVYPEILSWKDDDKKCGKCGKTKEEGKHDAFDGKYHEFQPIKNEIDLLYKRMKGLALVKTKKDCLTLPEKIYEKRICKPNRMITNLMKTILQRSESAIKSLILCRELSDGFQYTQEECGTQTCQVCLGNKTYRQSIYKGPEKTKEFLESIGLGEAIKLVDHFEDVVIDPVTYPQYFVEEFETCPACNGTGETKIFKRSTQDTKTSKDNALLDILEEYEDYGRLVVYAGFTASVDKCVTLATEKGWQVIRVDGRGWDSSLAKSSEAYSPTELIQIFQRDKSFDSNLIDNKICFIGHPGSSSTGLTLTASSCIVYYSNTFNGEERQQSEDRIHRLGMDENRGAKIIDLIHLPTDQYVLDNLLKKRRLQEMSTGQLQLAVEGYKPERYDYE